MDLRHSQGELADARAALLKAQKNGIPAAQDMARQRIVTAQKNADIAAGKLGLQKQEIEDYEGTVNGKPLPGVNQ